MTKRKIRQITGDYEEWLIHSLKNKKEAATYLSALAHHWQHDLAKSENAINAIHHTNQKEVGDDRHIKAINLSNQHTLSLKAENKNLKFEEPIDDSSKHDVNNQFVDYSKEVNDRRNQLHEEKEKQKTIHREVMDDYKRDGKLSNMVGGIGNKVIKRKE